MEIGQPGSFNCKICKSSFSNMQYLYKHVRQAHTTHPPTKNNRTCPICGIVFGIGKNESYKTHLRHIHGQRDEGQIFAFRCFNDFFIWKTELEKRTSCKYALQSAPKVLPTNEKIHVYQCDETPSKKKRFNVPNISNSKCPAMICATENMRNLEVKVDYWNTHVGHSVQAEQDELNAAISSLQEEDSHVQVMDMLNSIGQSVETGAEVFVTETVDEGLASTSSSRNISMNMFNAKRSKVNLPKTSPIVPNFSFKKDPSKKKESSIYSLASVACGKVSANKVNINKSASAQFQDLVKNIAKKNPGTIITNKATVPCESSIKRKEAVADKTNDSFNSEFSSNIDTIPESSKQTSTSNSHPSSIGGRFIAINPMPSTELSISNELSSIRNPSETSTGKSISDKENVSLVSNKNGKSLNKTTPRSLLKSNAKNSENSISTKNAMLGQNKKSLGIINADTPQIILASVPTPQQNLTSLVGVKKPETSSFSSVAQSTNSASQVVSPLTQTYLSIDNKLIPVVNTAGTALNPNLGSSIILSPALPQLSSGQIAQISLPHLSGGLFSYNKALLSADEKNASSQVQSVSSLSTSFPSAPVVLIPYSNSSTTQSLLQSKPSVSLSSPMVLQTVRPTTSLPTNSLGHLGLTPLSKAVPVAIGNLKNSSSTVVSSEKSTSPNIRKNHLSTTTTNTLKVQKVSLPTANSTLSASLNTNVQTDVESVSFQSSVGSPVSTNSTTVSSTPNVMSKSVNSKASSSQWSLVKPAVSNSKSITTTPNVNISKIFESKNHKPGTYVFESSGELFMLEPVDDDLMIKKSTTPLTSTPIKKFEIPKTVPDSASTNVSSTAKRKCSLDDGLTAKSKKFKEDSSSKPGKSAVYDASTKSAYIVNNDSPMFTDSSEEKSNSCSNGISNYSHKDSDSSKSKLENVLSFPKILASESSVVEEASINVQNKASLPENKSKTKHSPFTNLFPTKSSTLLSVKTIPSLAIHPSKPIASFVSSTRTQASNLILSSSSPNYISSIQDAGSSAEQSTLQIKSTSDKNCNSEANETIELEKQPEVKRVTIKSVAQEKRCITDSDLEIMKKVKFYKLEMQYYSCQAECKKLKIELAKALSKNKELMQVIEDLKKDENSVKENADVIKKTPIKKFVADNNGENIHNITTTDSKLKEDKTIEDNQDLEISLLPKDGILKQSGDEGLISDTAAPEKDHIISEKAINVADENGNSNKPETASFPDTVVAADADSIVSDQEMINTLEEGSDDSKDKDASISDQAVVSDMNDIISEKEIIHGPEENCVSSQAKEESILGTIVSPVDNTSDNEIDVSDKRSGDDKISEALFPNTVVDLNMDDITSDIEITDIFDENNANCQVESIKENICQTDLEQNNIDENIDEAILSETEKEFCNTPNSELVSKESDNSKADVYTMVRTSVLRNLYLDIEDLSREKQKLLDDMEHLKKLQPEIVPSIQD